MQHYRVAILGCRGAEVRLRVARTISIPAPRLWLCVTSCPSGWRNSATSWGVAARYDDLDRMIESEGPGYRRHSHGH